MSKMKRKQKSTLKRTAPIAEIPPPGAVYAFSITMHQDQGYVRIELGWKVNKPMQ